MLKIINGGSETFSSIVAGLLVYLKLSCALQAPSIVKPDEGKDNYLGGRRELPKGRWKVIRVNTMLVVAKIKCICTLADFLEKYRGSSISRHFAFKMDIYKMIKR